MCRLLHAPAILDHSVEFLVIPNCTTIIKCDNFTAQYHCGPRTIEELGLYIEDIGLQLGLGSLGNGSSHSHGSIFKASYFCKYFFVLHLFIILFFTLLEVYNVSALIRTNCRFFFSLPLLNHFPKLNTYYTKKSLAA